VIMTQELPRKKVETKIVLAAMFVLTALSIGVVGGHAVYADSCHGDCDRDGDNDGRDTGCFNILGIPVICGTS